MLEDVLSLDGELCPCWGETPDWVEPILKETPVMDLEVEQFVSWVLKYA